MLRKKNKNLFVVKTNTGRVLYRVEGEGYCFYEGKSMKFYFLDKVSSVFYLNFLGVFSTKEVSLVLEKLLGYPVEKSDFVDVKKYYLNSLPVSLLNA